MTVRHKRFRLSFVGPIEDQPRLIRAYGRTCNGEIALVVRPGEARGLLVLITPKDGAFVWQTGKDPAPSSVKATVLRDGATRLRLLTGPQADSTTSTKEELPRHFRHGDEIDVYVDGSGKVVGWNDGDAPRRPSTPISPTDAVKLVKAEQKGLPGAGPTTLRGRWTGFFHCDEGKPRVELHRKLAAYGTLTVTSNSDGCWSWRFERTSRWFGDDGVSSGDGLLTLAEAMEAGVLGAMSLVREACSFRDTRRRAALDPAYASKHPIKTPKPMLNPTERLNVKKAKSETQGKKEAPKKTGRRKVAKTNARPKSRSSKPPTESPEKKTQTKMVKRSKKTARVRSRKRPAEGQNTTNADSRKDQVLIEAFTAAISAAMSK
jgi:hypothetical protein